MSVLPAFAPGARIGLYGGSFNPPHAGHRLFCEIALRRLRLDRLWIMPTIGNPLKANNGLAPLPARIAALNELMDDPRIVVSDLEAHTHTRFTIDTLRFICARAPGVHFVWLMGADNLIQFNRWKKWREIADLMPMAIIDRPGATLRATASKTAQALARYRLAEIDAPTLPGRQAPAWVFLHDRRSPLSSSALRARQARLPVSVRTGQPGG
jgi:nicotinate-nucleotide adenylyltransferase